jgi:hypothetical protein
MRGFIKTGAEAGAVPGDSALRADATTAGRGDSDGFYQQSTQLDRNIKSYTPLHGAQGCPTY